MTIPAGGIPADDRPLFDFTIPEQDRVYPTDPKMVTLVHVRIRDELDAAKISGAQGTGVSGTLVELVRRSVVEIDGKPVDWGAPGGAEWLERASPPARARIMDAYHEVHAPPSGEEGKKAFLASKKVRFRTST